MDRLPAVILALAALAGAGCPSSKGSETEGRSRQRVNAVTAGQQRGADVEGSCDRHYPANQAPPLHWPALDGAEPPQAPAGSWQWINLWATWCKPCVEELPRLAAWQPRLRRAGVEVELVLVSADESNDVITGFRKQHRGVPPSLRLGDPDGAAGWIQSLGVAGATLPVHVFVDPGGKVRCVRASAIDDGDYPAIEVLLSGD